MNGQSLSLHHLDIFERLNLDQPSKHLLPQQPSYQLKCARSHQPLGTSLPDNNTETKLSKSKIQTKRKLMRQSVLAKHESNLSHVPCKFFKQGTCAAGANCMFSHNADLPPEQAVCKFYLRGNCKFGNKCALLHTPCSFVNNSRKPLAVRRVGGTATNAFDAETLSSASYPLPYFPSSLDFGQYRSSPAHDSFLLPRQKPDVLSGGVDTRLPFSFLSAAIRLKGILATSAPSLPWTTPSRKEQTNAMQISNSFYADTGYTSLSNMGGDSSSLPWGRLFRSLSSADAGMSSSSGLRHQQDQQSITEVWPSHSVNTFTASNAYKNGDGKDHDNDDLIDLHTDLNDAILPSSLNELLTPSELLLRKAKDQAAQQSVGGTPDIRSCRSCANGSPSLEPMRCSWLPLATQPLDVARSPFDPVTLPQQHTDTWHAPNMSPFELQDDTCQGLPTKAISIPACSAKVQDIVSELSDEDGAYQQDRFALFTDITSDDEGPFYMEDAEPVLSYDTTTGRHHTDTADERHTMPTNEPPEQISANVSKSS